METVREFTYPGTMVGLMFRKMVCLQLKPYMACESVCELSMTPGTKRDWNVDGDVC